MDDLISREKAIERIKKQCEHLRPESDSRDFIGWSAYHICIGILEVQPSAEPVQKTGHWERIFTCELHTVKCWNVFRCSECGSIKQIDANDYNWNYCPVCGSKNRGEKE